MVTSTVSSSCIFSIFLICLMPSWTYFSSCTSWKNRSCSSILSSVWNRWYGSSIKRISSAEYSLYVSRQLVKNAGLSILNFQLLMRLFPFLFKIAFQLVTLGISSHVLPSSSLPAFFLFFPPICLKKNGMFACRL